MIAVGAEDEGMSVYPRSLVLIDAIGGGATMESHRIAAYEKGANGHERTGRVVRPIQEWTRADHVAEPSRPANPGAPSVITPRSTRTRFPELEALRQKLGASD